MLFERDTELEQLHQLLADVESAGGRVVLVRGEAGIGKSALVGRFLDEVEDEAFVLVGECDDLLTPQPLAPIWDVAASEASLLGPLAQGDRRGVMGSLLDLLCRGLRPTVLAVEDVQWADEATLDVIRFLGRRVSRANGLLVLTYRDGEVAAFHPLRPVIGAVPPQNLVRMQLHGLSRDAVAAMVGDRGLDVDEVVALSGGNPLMVSEMVTWGVDPVPASLRDAVLGRAAGLSEAGRRVLELVSVAPGGASCGLLDRTAGGWRGPVAECERMGFLGMRGESAVFRHELVRRAVESSLSDVDRRELNRRVLEALEAGTDPAVVTHHAREAGDVAALIAAAPRAARAAMAVESRREALEHFRALEPHLKRFAPAEQAGLLVDRARVEQHFDYGAAGDAVSRAIEVYRAAGLERDLARTLTLAVRLFELGGRPGDGEASVVEAVEILRRYPPDGDMARAVGQQAWLALFHGDRRRAVALADEAIRMAEEAGDEPTAIEVLNTKGVALADEGDPGGLALLEESRSRAESHGHVAEELRALANAAALAADFLDLDAVTDLAQRLLTIAVRHEFPSHEAWAKVILAWVELYRGRWDAAYDGFREALAAFSDPDDPHHYPQAVIHQLNVAAALATLQARRGLPEAGATLNRAWELVEAAPWPQSYRRAGLATAEYVWLTGDPDPDLAAVLREALGSAPIAIGFDPGRLAFWLWKLGHLAEIPEGIAEPFRVLMGGRPTEAARLWEAKGYPYEQALCLMHGDDHHQLEALRIFEGLGAVATADKLRRMLHDRGVRAPRRAPETRRHPAGLTARQAQVLDLLGEDLSNAEIADRLFISARTAEHHVEAILSRLGVTSRHDAVTEARRLGLLAGS